MKDKTHCNEEYVGGHCETENLREHVGGSRALSNFLDKVVQEKKRESHIEYKNVGAIIHAEIDKSE